MSEAKIVKFKKQRGQVKACVTNVESWYDQNHLSADVADVEVQLERLHKYEGRFDEIQSNLEDIDPTEFDQETDERLMFDERVSIVKANLMKIKHHIDFHNSTLESQNRSNHEEHSVSDLPKLDLPKFSGDYLEFPYFYDTFKVMVHDVKMNDIHKFALLKSCLVGQAASTIENLPLIAGNYPVAIQMLEERFLKKRLIFTSFIKKIWDLPRATNTASLRQLSDSYVSIAKGLELIADDLQIANGLVVHLLTTKCDQKTLEDWERTTASKNTFPTELEFTTFLRNRCNLLEGMEYALKTTSKPSYLPPVQKNPKRHVNTVSSDSPSKSNVKIDCPKCNSNHKLFECPDLLMEEPKQRYYIVKKLNFCVRCLQTSKHSKCTAKCSTCGSSHHSLLHFEPKITSTTRPNPNESSSTTNLSKVVKITSSDPSSVENVDVVCTNDPSCDTYTFLATALVHAQTADGNYVPLRVLFDGGSQLNLISDRARRLLGLSTFSTKNQIHLSGINNATITLRKRMVVKLKSIWSSFHESVMLVVHPKFKQIHPSQNVNVSSWQLPDGIQLADPEFNKSQQVDLVLNAQLVDQYMMSGSISLGENLPRLRETKFGWVVVGDWAVASRLSGNSYTYTVTQDSNQVVSEPPLSDLLRRFWEVESIKPVKMFSSEEREMEQHFEKTTSRLPNGQFMVRLPFSKSPEALGESKYIALKRLSTIVRKVRTQADYGDKYNEFIDEYIALGHCSKVEKPLLEEPHYYIPHFAVTNENSTTTQTRVVFDASCLTDNNTSLNQLLMVGPKLQDDLFDHLLRFRTFKYALTGDVSKMYRQILVHPDDRKFQYIFWQKHNEKYARTYELNTVTYGTASAPYQAVKCLQEIAKQDGKDFPLAQKVILKNFYVDDMLTGTNDENEAFELYSQVKTLLSKGQMIIRKFQSNSERLMSKIPPSDRGSYLKIGDKEVIKTLGIIWDPCKDEFEYYYEPNQNVDLSRRNILSEIARLYDPLGLIQPVIIKAKLFMQKLFTTTANWDDPLSQSEINMWQDFRCELAGVHIVTLPRSIIKYPDGKSPIQYEIHGFCDASELAYAACIYIRSIYDAETSHCRLLVSKTRVAPLKKVSLPRLELLGAVLLSELYSTVIKSLELRIDRSVLWTDSTITLRWVTESPHRWTSYVGTRATKIQNATIDCEWRHIPTQLNPADLATRGMSPNEISMSALWQFGPRFLLLGTSVPWPPSPTLPNKVPEEAKVANTLLTCKEVDLIARCKIISFVPLINAAVWPKLKRIFAYVNRFIVNIRKKCSMKSNSVVNSKSVIPLDTDDINSGERLIIKIVQQLTFASELKSIRQKNLLPPKSKFNKWAVFMDDCGFLRVGGRNRERSDISTHEEKFPYLLPADHVVTKLIFLWYHFESLHAGPSALVAFVRQRFWPFKAKILANRTVYNCIRCSRVRPVTFKQIMGDLPKDRVTGTKPFEVTAVDFAGPFQVHYRLRGSKITKAYLAIFVCFSTKAVHLELVEDLTTEAFLNCLQRFTSRRSTPKKIWSDNATNFAGASKLLSDFKEFFFNPETQKSIVNWCRDHKGLDWCFTPPRTPHFNGLVEAAVKSAKFHLLRVAHLDSLTFGELNTVIIMVEGILNARPLIPLSNDPSDEYPITPAHFLVGAPLESLHEPEVDPKYSKRWDKTVAIKQAFWRRWSKDYLHLLQERHKWIDEHAGPQINDLVLLVDRDIAPLKWKLGKVVKLYPGKDNRVRVVNVETKNGTYRRGITEICPIPKAKVMDEV